MTRRIEQRKSLFQGKCGIGDRSDDDLPTLDRHSHALIDPKIRRLGDGRRQSR